MTKIPELNILLSNQPILLRRLKSESIDIPASLGDFPEISFRNQKLCTLNFRDRESMVLLLFADAQGALRHASFVNAPQ
jgi:hypothetical protein